MGTWALPQTAKKAKELQKLLAKPLLSKVAAERLYHLLGDDDLFDKIAEAKEKDGDDCDVRIFVESALRDFLDNEENAAKTWGNQAYEICQNICQSLEELYIPY